MKTSLLIAFGIALAAIANVAAPRPAHALTMAECSAKYKAAKTAGTLNGMKWNDFRKAQCGAEATAAPAAAPAAPAPAPAAAAPAPAAPAATTAEKKPVSGGRQAMYARERACGKEWKEAKAAGKTAGQKWPQYWSECDKRKKAEGM